MNQTMITSIQVLPQNLFTGQSATSLNTSNFIKEKQMKELNFNDRETYLAWRKQWKDEYKQLSKDIRQAKIDYKTQQRRIIVVIADQGKAWQWYSARIDGNPVFCCKEYIDQYILLQKSQKTAREMLSLLCEAKAKSAKQRLASLAIHA